MFLYYKKNYLKVYQKLNGNEIKINSILLEYILIA